jgi:hypothetical protein
MVRGKHERLSRVAQYLEEIMEEGERIMRRDALPLAHRAYWAGQAVAAGRVLAYLLDDEKVSERTWEIWKYASELRRVLIDIECAQAQV